APEINPYNSSSPPTSTAARALYTHDESVDASPETSYCISQQTCITRRHCFVRTIPPFISHKNENHRLGLGSAQSHPHSTSPTYVRFSNSTSRRLKSQLSSPLHLLLGAAGTYKSCSNWSTLPISGAHTGTAVSVARPTASN
ncbi:unnamed protein product, partial [Ectocarpus sp. 13 AM-2016]